MKKLIIRSLISALMLAGMGLTPAQADAGDEVAVVANNLASATNANSSQVALDLYASILQKAHPSISMDLAFTQGYFNMANIYKSGSYSCVTINPGVISNPKAVRFKTFPGSTCTNVMKVLAPYAITEGYLDSANRFLADLGKTIVSIARADAGAKTPSIYLENSLKSLVLPPQITYFINGNTLTLSSTVVSGLSFDLVVSKNTKGDITTVAKNNSTPNILGIIEPYLGEELPSSIYVSKNPSYISLVGKDQIGFILSTILNGIHRELYIYNKSQLHSFFIELASLVTSNYPTTLVKVLSTDDFEVTTVDGVTCLTLSAKSTSFLVYTTKKSGCDSTFPSNNPKIIGNKNLVNSEAKRLLSFLTTQAFFNKKLLTMKDYISYIDTYHPKTGVSIAIDGNTISVFDLSVINTKATITYGKSKKSRDGSILSGLKLTLVKESYEGSK